MLDGVCRTIVRLEETGVEIALLDWGGDGPLALLHHANGFCAGVWGLVAEPLSRHFRVIAMDARGHGDSSKPEGAEFYQWPLFGRDLAAVAERLASAHPDGCIALGLGHSFGGTSMLMAAGARPELFARLVLVDPVLPALDWIEPDPGHQSRGNALIDGARNRRHVWPSREAALEKWRGKELFARWDPRALELYVQEGMRDRDDGQVELKCPGAIEAAVFQGSREVDVLALGERVSAPTLIQRAAQGHFPRPLFDQLAARMADATVVEIDAGHLAVMERPDLVVDGVLGFAT